MLSTQEGASGQKVNQNNTVIFFSKSTSKTTRQIIKGILGVQEIKHYEKYFSLPSLMGKGKKASFNYIKERVWRKQSGQEGKFLSQAWWEVLLKAFIQAIPTHAMDYFKLPFLKW